MEAKRDEIKISALITAGGQADVFAFKDSERRHKTRSRGCRAKDRGATLKSFCLKASRPRCGGMTHGATRASVGARDGDGREAEGDEFAGKFPSADGNDDVLLPIQHVGHGRAALRRGHVHGT